MTSVEDLKSRRRPHTKSRLGCQQCKQRKIKCNEDRPVCLNCIQRDRECNYPTAGQKSEQDRQSFTKSRLGCQQCKQRKIKCNEDRPICLNCVQRDMECSFALLAQRTAELDLEGCSCDSPTCNAKGSGSEAQDLREIVASQGRKLELMSQQMVMLQIELAQLKGSKDPSTLDHTEMELLYHYFLMTTHNHAKEDFGHNFWCVRLLELGFKHPHVLHLILGFAALDKARCTPDRQADFLKRAERYHTLGLQAAAFWLGAINDENYEVVYASALLISLHNLSRGPQPGEYLGFSTQGRSSFTVFLRGLKSIREYKKEPENETLVPFPELPARNCALPATPKYSHLVDYNVHIQGLRDLVEDTIGSLDDELKASCLEAVDQLEPFFAAAFKSGNLSPKGQHPSDAYVQVPLGWLCRVPETYLNYLEAKEPLALVIFAHFAVVLKELQSGWPIHDWPEHIMSGILEFLPTEKKGLVRWPIQELELDFDESMSYLPTSNSFSMVAGDTN